MVQMQSKFLSVNKELDKIYFIINLWKSFSGLHLSRLQNSLSNI